MTPAEKRSEDYARSHRSPETAAAVAHRRAICQACWRCIDIAGDVVHCGSTVKAPILTIADSCPIKLW